MPNYELITKKFKESFYKTFTGEYKLIDILSVHKYSTNYVIVRTLEKVSITSNAFFKQFMYEMNTANFEISYIEEV